MEAILDRLNNVSGLHTVVVSHLMIARHGSTCSAACSSGRGPMLSLGGFEASAFLALNPTISILSSRCTSIVLM